MERKFSISEVMGTSWKVFKQQIWILAGLFVAYFILVSVIEVFNVPTYSVDPVHYIICTVLTTILGTLFSLGYIKNCFQALDGEEPQFSAYINQSLKFFTYIVASILYTIIVVLGIILFIVPGVILALRLQFFITFIVDENCGIKESFEKSWDITSGQGLKLFWLMLIMFGIILLGFLALIVGIFIAVPFTNVLYCNVFRKLNTLKTAEEIKETV